MAKTTEWTSQQETAINARGSSVIVSAAAGSGKTAVLTERLARLISDESAHVRADRIIAVTFTNDAASELRKRLDSKLNKLISEDPSNKYLLKQQTLLQNAKISTINSFCFEILRDNITDQGITSSFGILDESEDKLIKSQSMDELINYFTTEHYDDISFLYDKFCLKNDSGLAQVISEVDDYLGSEAFRDIWMKKAVAEFEKQSSESIFYEKVRKQAISDLKRAMELAADCRTLIDSIFYDPDGEYAKKLIAQCEEDTERVRTALEIYENSGAPSDAQRLYCYSFARRYAPRKTTEFDPRLMRIYAAKRSYVVKLVRDNLGVLSGFDEDFSESGRITKILCEMIGEYHRLIWEKKCEKNSISFDDGERLALELLAEVDENEMIRQSDTARRTADYYDIIMIDEYQDSNNKQDLIFKLLSKDFTCGSDGAKYGTNAFVVGDVKQSIYRFRLANPRNFINTLKVSVPYESEEESPNRSVFLNRNFRSSRGVIGYVNYIFGLLMSENCGDVLYNEDEMLYFGAKHYEESDTPADFKTEIMLINTNQFENNETADDEDEDEQCEESAASVDAEAACVAERISSMLKNGEKVIENGIARPCNMSDFCILIRAKKYTSNFIEELKKRGIDARGEEEKGYLSSREIAILLDLLRVIDNPLLDVPLAAVLLSPMCMFSLEELSFLRSLNGSGSLYSILSGYAADHSGTPLAAKCSGFLETLADFRLEAVTKNVSELIADIYEMTDFIFVMQMYDDGERKRANLRALVQYAKVYEEASADGTGGLTGFIRYIDRIIENGDDFSQGKMSAAAGDYVSVKTIHKSKGLEYPFVFLAETSGRFRFDSGNAICSENGRVGYVLYSPENVRRHKTAQYRYLFRQNKKDTISEELRLLYVALTRAKQKLFINLKFSISAVSKVCNLIEKYVVNNCGISSLAEEAGSLSEWLWISLMEHRCFGDIVELFRKDIDSLREDPVKMKQFGISDDKLKKLETSLNAYDLPEVRYTDDVFRFVQVSPLGSAENENDVETEIYAPDEELCGRIRDMIGFEYDTVLSHTPSKLSVTQITKKLGKEDEFFDFKLSRPRFLSEKKTLTGAERGTAIHTFFQYCSFEKASSDLESEISELVSRGYITETQADSISRENAAAFFGSDLYGRIMRADKIWRERKFMAAVSDLAMDMPLSGAFKNSDGMIKGIIDLVFEKDGHLVIVDYKSDRRISENMLAERYRNQLRLYKSAIELITGETVSELYLYSFELQKSIKLEIQDND